MSKKQHILETAIQLFAKQGIEATSIQTITQAAGISKGAFYLSFSSKEELIKEIVDTFMKEFVADIDQVVSNSLSPENKLHQYFLAHLGLLEKHADFAKMYTQEQMYAINEEIVEKLMHYDSLIDQALLLLLKELFGDSIENRMYDLLISIKGFVRIYSQLVLFHPYPHDIERIAEILVENTKVLAKHSNESYLTYEMVHFPSLQGVNTTSREDVLNLLHELREDQHPVLIQETLLLLSEELTNNEPRKAMVYALQKTLEEYTPTKWLSYVVKQVEIKKDAK